MALAAGDKLGPYEILAPIGAGGMGEVYRGRDNRLAREIAIKVSAGQSSERFEKEARAIAALNHPNICTLHDVGPNYLVMELVEGPTLADRTALGKIPSAETLAIARQIADALEAAHEPATRVFPSSQYRQELKQQFGKVALMFIAHSMLNHERSWGTCLREWKNSGGD